MNTHRMRNLALAAVFLALSVAPRPALADPSVRSGTVVASQAGFFGGALDASAGVYYWFAVRAEGEDLHVDASSSDGRSVEQVVPLAGAINLTIEGDRQVMTLDVDLNVYGEVRLEISQWVASTYAASSLTCPSRARAALASSSPAFPNDFALVSGSVGGVDVEDVPNQASCSFFYAAEATGAWVLAEPW